MPFPNAPSPVVPVTRCAFSAPVIPLYPDRDDISGLPICIVVYEITIVRSTGSPPSALHPVGDDEGLGSPDPPGADAPQQNFGIPTPGSEMINLPSLVDVPVPAIAQSFGPPPQWAIRHNTR